MHRWAVLPLNRFTSVSARLEFRIHHTLLLNAGPHLREDNGIGDNTLANWIAMFQISVTGSNIGLAK